ncbi:MAG TPA: DUF892 family protein, partial [Puia sp.]|nr:DUF892 family protein [Puia sp.]
MRSKTASKSANGFKTKGSADKKQNAGTTSRRQGTSGRGQHSADGRRQESGMDRGQQQGRQSASGKGQQRAGGRGQQGSAGREQQRSKSEGSSPQDDSPLEKFFLDQLKDIYYAEQKITQSLPKMQEAATTSPLKDAFEDHLRQTERHVKRLEKVFQALNQKPEGKKCEAIEGIAREVESIIKETPEGTLTRDAALIMAAQKVEHYEIATYGGLVQLAITMELHDVADLLDKTLMEEEDTDALLTEIAENEVNLGAEHEGSQYSWNRGKQGNNEGRQGARGRQGGSGSQGKQASD